MVHLAYPHVWCYQTCQWFYSCESMGLSCSLRIITCEKKSSFTYCNTQFEGYLIGMCNF